MAKLEGKITKTILDAWTREDDRLLRDGELIGFMVEVYPSGNKTFFLEYVNKYGKKRRTSIGRYGAITLEQARREANKILAKVRLEGYDPLEERAKNKDALTVSGLLDVYFKSARFKEKALSTQKTDIGKMNGHIRPLLGKRQLEVLTPDLIRKTHADIAAGATAKKIKSKNARGVHNVRGGDGAARNVIRVFRAILNWAVAEGMMLENPASKIKLGSDGEREAALQTTEEYKRLFNALTFLDETKQIPTSAANAIRILALTGARRNEIAAARWSYVVLERGVLTLPAGQHKTGHGTDGKAKEIPLPSAALAILAVLVMGEPDDYVFSADSGVTHAQLGSNVWAKIRKEAVLPYGTSNHTLRHSLGTMLAIQGAEAAQIMAALGHTQLSTTQRYINIAKDARAQLLEHHTSGIAAALAGNTKKADVVELKTKEAK